MSWKDRAIPAGSPAEAPVSSWKDRAISADAEPVSEDAPAAEATSEELPDLGRLEAAAISTGQGAGFGLTPILSGIVGAGLNAGGQIGDKLGLTTDSELEEQGFTQPDKKSGLEGLMQAYYDSRDSQKAHQEAAADQYPVQSFGANVLGGAASTVATAPLAAGSKIAGAILPNTQSLASGTLGAKVLAGTREGVKAGALNSFGDGNAKLMEGELADTAIETGAGAVGGGLLGGAIPGTIGAVKGVGSLVTDLPIAKQMATAFKGGKAGIKLDEKSGAAAVKTYSEDLLNEIKTRFKEAGLTKANAMDYADEVGVRVDAGEAFDDVMDEMIQRGASGSEDLAGKLKLFNSLKSLKDGPADKAGQKLEVNRAKNIQKMEAKGFQLLDEDVNKGNVQDFIPGAESDKNLLMAKQNFQKLGTDEVGDGVEGAAAESPIVSRLVQQAGDTLPIDIRKYDLNNLSLRDLEEVLGDVNLHTGDLTGPAKSNSEKVARGLAAQLRSLSEDAIEGMGQGTESGNKQLSKTFAALGRAGIDDNVLTGNKVRQDEMVDKLRGTITSGNGINRERMFQYLNEANPEAFAKYEPGAEFLNDFTKLAKQVKPLSTSSLDALAVAGGAKNTILTGANKVGSMVGGLSKLTSLPGTKVKSMADRVATLTDPAKRSYAGPLAKAAASDDRKRAAILYGLYQQPAFREMYQSLGEEIMPELDSTAEKMNNQLLNQDEEN